ncbi:MAG TPA: hypothetical protein VMU01_07865 [Rhizomicrobium sp.]|nr:hypothetical protein [Rhizomicrobium sp.]
MLLRRGVLSGLSVLPFAARGALAKAVCTYPNDYGIRRCSVGLDIGPIETARQRKDHWCWAASISAIFKMHGHPVDQRRIVDKVFVGVNVDNYGAAGPDIVTAVDGAWTDDAGRKFAAKGTVLIDAQFGYRNPLATVAAARQLAADNGLIIGSEGHACVLTEMTYDVSVLTGAYVLWEMTVRDPWPGNVNKRVYRPDEAGLVAFLCAVTVKTA